MKHLKAYKLLNLASTAVVALVLFIIAMFLYIRFWPVDVIRNDTWKLTVEKSEYKVGETVTVHILSDKVRNVGGWFTTTAECKKDGVFVSYPISEQRVNRAVGHVETSIDTAIPNKVPNLPSTCRIAYILEYTLFSFRSFSEYNFTNEFILMPPEDKVAIVETTVNNFTTTTSGQRPVQSVTVTRPAAVSQPPQPTQSVPTQPKAETLAPRPQNCAIDIFGIKLFCS